MVLGLVNLTYHIHTSREYEVVMSIYMMFYHLDLADEKQYSALVNQISVIAGHVP